MKKVLLFSILILLYGCDRIIENAFFEEPDHIYDTFVKIENNSLYNLEKLDLSFYNNNYYFNYIIKSKETTTYPSEHDYINDTPYISFYIDDQFYEMKPNNNGKRIDSGNYLLKITVLSTNSKAFSYELIETD